MERVRRAPSAPFPVGLRTKLLLGILLPVLTLVVALGVTERIRQRHEVLETAQADLDAQAKTSAALLESRFEELDSVLTGVLAQDALATLFEEHVHGRDVGGASAWGHVSTVQAGDSAAGDAFGWRVQLEDDRLWVGAPQADFGDGAVYRFDLDASVRAPDGERHGRHLLHLDPGSGIAVIAMAWPGHADSLPHDHGTWGTVGVVDGTLRLTTYDRLDDGHDPAHARLAATCCTRVERGAIASVLPPHDEVHRIENPTDQPALSLHTYGRTIERCHSFDPETGAVHVVAPTFTSRP